MAKIVITGGTGLVGTRLTEMLREKHHKVLILSRNPSNENELKWDIAKGYIDKKAFENTDYIIHLAGAGIAEEKWTDKRKKIIIDSRVETTNLLFNTIKENDIKLKGFISASGIGYYGAITTAKIFKETDAVGNDYIGDVCQKWENAAHQFDVLKIPVTILRTGIVLSKTGGALEKMRTPVISPLGSGNQYLPWIHIDDLCEMYIDAIEGKLNGVYNAVAPEHHTSKTFSKTLAKSINRPFVGINVPGFMLKLLFGDLSQILLEGSRISAEKIKNSGFIFKFETLKKALNNL
jgi:uncharacterized protein (TIGR01777 family)